MSKNGVTNIVVAGFPNHAGYPFHDLRLIVEVLSQVAADQGVAGGEGAGQGSVFRTAARAGAIVRVRLHAHEWVGSPDRGVTV